MEILIKKYIYKLIPFLILLSLGFLVFSNTLTSEFVWDDTLLIEKNVYLKDWTHIPKLFTRDIGAGAGLTYGFYRPVLMLSLMLDYSMWGLDVRGYHAMTILLHVLAALGVYYFALLICKDKNIALFSSMLFLVHPIQCEDVAYVTGRADSLFLIFLLLSFISYVYYSGKASGIYLVAASFFYVLSLLSKENGLILPVLALLYHHVFKVKVKKAGFFLITGIAALYLGVVMFIIRPDAFSSGVMTSWVERVPGFFVAFRRYLTALFIPVNLHMGHMHKTFQLADAGVILGIVFFIIFLAITWAARRSNMLFYFCLLWFFMGLIPVSNVVIPASSFMAYRYLYLPAIGIFIIFSSLSLRLNRIRTVKRFSGIPILFCIGLFSLISFNQNRYWSDPVRFFKRTVDFVPENLSAWNNLAAIYMRRGQRVKAVRLFEKMIRQHPDFHSPYNNLANLYKDMGRIDEAIALYRKAIQLRPNSSDAYNNLGKTYVIIGKKDEAIEWFEKAISVNEACVGAYVNLGTVYLEKGRFDKSGFYLEKAIRLDPDCAEAYNNLSVLCYRTGKISEAIEYCRKAQGLGTRVHPEFLALINKIEHARN